MKHTTLALSALALAAPALVAAHAHLRAPAARTVDVYFSPDGGAQGAILDQIRAAKESIQVAMYAFTDDMLADELVLRSINGVDVQVLLDATEARAKYSKARDLVKGDSKVRVVRLKPEAPEDQSDEPARFHHKFCVVDGRTVMAGSYNWTWGAEKRNNEDLMVLSMRSVARDYQERFEDLWREAGGE